jgi:hypothetical protein
MINTSVIGLAFLKREMYMKLTMIVFLAICSTVSLANMDKKFDGSSDGKVVTYYKNGSKMADKLYKDGTPVGIWKSWYDNGKIHTEIKFLGNTGQIEKIEVRHPNGALMYKGIATIKDSLKEKDEKYMTVSLSECRGIASKTDDGSKWYNEYELDYYSYYEDGTCEKITKDNLHQAYSSLYFRANDITTGKTYDFPWFELWDSVPDFLNKKKSDK